MRVSSRRVVRVLHLWLGLIAGLFICLMGVTGGLVALRPQIAGWLAPSAPRSVPCLATPDWNGAARQVTAVTHSDINRIYGPYGADTRYHFRMMTGQDAIYRHVVYDACSGQVLGSINLAWMDWTVDLHHNLLAGRAGRRWAGWIGVVMLISGVSGFLVWLMGRPSLAGLRVSGSFSRSTPRQVHRLAGLAVSIFLVLEAFTGLWLCFPQTMRGLLAIVSPPVQDVRPARNSRPSEDSGRAGLAELIAAARRTFPGGLIREIRLPEGNGPVQVRMWRSGDFRSLGNNVVYLSARTAQVLAVDRYSDRPASSRFIQAMAALHYDEWGGLSLRMASAVAGVATPLLFLTGFLIWWYSRKPKIPPPSPKPQATPAEIFSRSL